LKILAITGGAAGMYCGSCLRDNALATELMALGHEVVLLPLYTPTLTDETNVSQDRVFFGGISVYLEQNIPLFRRTPEALDRLWDSRFALRLASRRSIRTDPRWLAEMTISMLKGEDGNQRKELRKLLRWLESEPPPDVINLPFLLVVALARPLKQALGRPVCCTLQGEDLFLESLEEPYRSEAMGLIRSQLEHVDAFLPLSAYYERFMSEYLGIPRSKMRVTPLGISMNGHAAGPRPRSEVFTVGYFARIAPEKGLDLLCEAYRQLRQRSDLGPWRLEAAGYLGPEHHEYLHGIERRIREWGLGQEFHYRGALDRAAKIRFLQSLDVMSVPSPYREPKGAPVLEAMANGVPVVQPRHGAFPEIIEKTGGGLLFDPHDAASLAGQILRIWQDPELARGLGSAGARGVREHYSARQMALRALEVYSEITEQVKVA